MRLDPFSSYRSGFEVRTYRLCRRVLMFHHFPDELRTDSCLVRSTALHYEERPFGSFIMQAVQSGHRRQDDGRNLTRSLPALEFSYSSSPLDDSDFADYRLEEVDRESLANLPGGIDGDHYRWLDLDGEGISGVLAEQDRSWFYKPNLGDGRFGALKIVATRPSLAALSGGRQEFMDIAGDGNLDLVDLSAPVPGFYERTLDAGWTGFRTFHSLPVRDWGDANLRFVDLTGDGIADVLITEDDAFTWHPSLLREGFGPGIRVSVPLDEGKEPRIVFADGTQSIYLADLTGDGLSDILRIRNGEVCYWPNRGYGRFGAKVTMDHSPWFDEPDLFDQRRIRLADTDGSGTTDILYLSHDGVRIFLNETGNGWSSARHLAGFPTIDDLAAISVSDFLGRGTACLLWSSPLPSDAGRQVRYVDLMCGHKPHLLVHTENNLGAETRIDYASSTAFYLADKVAGTPWVTRLPFPVHVVERVETYDHVSRNRFVTRYTYHHGFYDGVEREFRGFGRVDQLDTEEFAALTASGSFPVGDNVAATSNVPPVLTKTWFHTGVYLQGGRIARHLAHEYYREGSRRRGEAKLSDAQIQAMLLDDVILPAHLTPDEAREACRSLKGAMLRQEVYALDDSEASSRPYMVAESNLTIRLLQQQRTNRHAVFFTHARESIAFHYERALYDIDGCRRADPRVSHEVTLAVDDYGNVLQSVAIGYGRRFPDRSPLLTNADRAKHAKTLLTLAETDYTNSVRDRDAYRTPLPAESRTYELLRIWPDAALPDVTNLFRFDELLAKVQAAGDGQHDIAYEDRNPTALQPGHPYRRVIGRERNLYRPNDLGASTGDPSVLLPTGKVESQALLGTAYKLTFTPGLIAQVYRRDQTDLLPAPAEVLGVAGSGGGGYVDMDNDRSWWVPAGRIFYHSDPKATPEEELVEAQRHFFLPRRFVDAFGHPTAIDLDRHDLLVERTTDAVGNISVAANDYRVLQPTLVVDANGNRAAVAFDALGLVAGSAVMGKLGEAVGDTLEGFSADLSPAQIETFFAGDDPHALAPELLAGATARAIYDPHRFWRTRAAHPRNREGWEPAFVANLARETHAADPPPPGGLKIQISFSHSDGLGREVQKKAQCEPGPVVDGGPMVSPRWIASGWTILNNKGKPIRKFEPFFSQQAKRGFRFEFGLKVGVSAILFYDPMQRVVATLRPDHSFEKTMLDPWTRQDWDANDTVLIDPATDPDLGPFVRRLPRTDYLPTWYQGRADGGLGAAARRAAEKTAAHAATPSRAFSDVLGRPFVTFADNGNGRLYPSRTSFDIKGAPLSIADACGREAVRYDYDMLGRQIHQTSMEGGTRWTLQDAAGKPIRAWNGRGYVFSTEYDALRRPLRSFVQGGDPTDPNGQVFPHSVLYERAVYGDSPESGLSEAEQKAANLRGKVIRHFDAAGLVTTDLYNFKSNSLRNICRFARDYRGPLDWSREPQLEPETFVSRTAYDALDRIVETIAPDRSVFRLLYNEASLLSRIDVALRGAEADAEPVWTPFVSDTTYNARGQRTAITYSNGAQSISKYDLETFRLVRLTTARAAGRNGLASALFKDPDLVQDLRCTFDPTGNVTQVADLAQQTVFHQNHRVDPVCDYTYDPLYRLIEATGRENVGQSAFQSSASGNNRDYPFVGAAALGDLHALRNFTERYDYDAVGNILSMTHLSGRHGGWSRAYAYQEPSQIDTAAVSNRLSWTSLQAGAGAQVYAYRYDAHGNISQMPHLPLMRWDFKDQLAATSSQAAEAEARETTFYIYDAAGRRARVVTQRANGVRRRERYYLGGFEIYRKYRADGELAAERQTLHVMGGEWRLALVETQTVEHGDAIAVPKPALRYQIADHLNSSSLELDGSCGLITYEAYAPYGSTNFQAGRSAAEVSLKRYRFTGKERDEGSGFAYHGARYYAPWLGRWTAADPGGVRDGLNLYQYARGCPTTRVDRDGMDSGPPDPLASSGHKTDPAKPPRAGNQQGSAGSATSDSFAWDVARVLWGLMTSAPSQAIAASDTALRDRYKSANVARATAASKDIQALRGTEQSVAATADEAAIIARQASAARNAARATTQGEVSPLGWLISKIFERDRSWEAIVARRGGDPFNSDLLPEQRIALADQIAQKSGATSKWVGALQYIGKGLMVAGSFFNGFEFGGGINKIREGKVGEGVVDMSEGASNFGLTVYTYHGVKAGTIATEGGLAGGAMTLASALAAAGSLWFAFEDTRRAINGERSLPEEAMDYWGGVVKSGEERGGVLGHAEQAGAYTMKGLAAAPHYARKGLAWVFEEVLPPWPW